MKCEFEYGPAAKGAFIALICIAPLVSSIIPDALPHYLLFLLFLGLGLRPLLVSTGLHRFWRPDRADIEGSQARNFVERRRASIDMQARMRRLRYSSYRQPRLPKNW